MKNNRENQKNITTYKTNIDGRAIIDVGAENYGDIFSYYSLDDANAFDTECSDFIESRADLIPLDEDLTIRFHIKQSNEKKRKEIEDAMRENYLREYGIIIKKLKQRSLFSIIMLLSGVLLFGLYYLSVVLNLHISIQFFMEIATWVFVWEAVNSFFLERQHLKLERFKKNRLLNAKVEVKEFKSRVLNNQKKTKKRKESDQ